MKDSFPAFNAAKESFTALPGAAADRLTGVVMTQVRVRRIAVRVVLALGGVLTGLGLLLIIAGWTEDAKIDGQTGRANAEVVSVSVQRTLVRFQSPDGAEHIPSVGVLYPEALEEGQTVQVEYDLANPELVRVAGRGTWLMLLPVGTTLLLAWAVLLPVVWWLRRRPAGM